jgi:ATP-dependent Clp endopeptidase proteolytic subunit ClpP
MPKPWYQIKAASEGSDTAEVSILEEISAWYGCNAKSFLTEFRALKAKNVDLYINSPGGSVIEALAIFNGMRASGKNITVHVLGIAASAASYIAMAGDKVVMPKNTLMFLHNPINGVYGNAEDLRDAADDLDKMGGMLSATYAKRWKGDEKALADVLANESLLTADECLEYGLCDEVVDEIKATASFDVDTLPPAARAVFAAAAVKPPVADPAPAADTALAEQIAAHAKAAGLEAFAAVFALAPEAGTLDGARALIETARQVKSLATAVGMADQADALIRSRKTVAEARTALAEVYAASDVQIDSTLPAPKKGAAAAAATDYSPTSVWAIVNEMKASKQ